MTYAGLAPDSHTLRVRSVDSAGNVEPEPAEWSWDILESEPPEATITNHPPAVTTDAFATFTFISDESGSTFVCSLDLGAEAPCTSPRQYTGLGIGTHVFAVKAIDPAGNISPADTLHVDGRGTRHDATGVDHRRRARELDDGHQRHVHVHGERGRRDVQLLAGHGTVRRVHVAGDGDWTGARQPHVPGAGA